MKFKKKKYCHSDFIALKLRINSSTKLYKFPLWNILAVLYGLYIIVID